MISESMLLNNEDEAILSVCQNDKDDLYKHLFALYEKKIFNAANKIVQNEDAAKDIVQETFLSFYINKDKFEGRSKIYTWLYRVASNKSIDFVRKAIRERKRVSKTSESEMLAESKDDKIVLEIITAEALEKLSEDFRAPLLLLEYENMSYLDISKELDLPVNTVRTRIFRARKKMLSILKKKGVSL